MSVLACGVVWVVLGRTAWWVPAFAFGFLGGYINVGFTIYPHEIGMGLSLAAIVLFIAAHPRRFSGRPPLDWSFYVLVAYMLGHLAVSYYFAVAAGMSGTGTIARLYVNGLWAIVFALLFWAYGDLRHFRLALVLATVFCIVRIGLGLLAFVAPNTNTIQESAFFFAPVDSDLRASALALTTLLVLWFYRSQRRRTRVVILLAYVAAIYLVFLGASRVAALIALASPLIWAIAQRRRGVLLVGIIAAATLIVAINYSAGVYGSLPDGARRSLSTFVVTRYVEEHSIVAYSDTWHYMLVDSGRKRWTADLVSFVFGTRLEGWNQQYSDLTRPDDMADVAARLAAFESAFFTVTVTLGLVGLLLFVRAVYWLYRPFAWNILRNGIRSQDDALAFVAVQSLVTYLALSWIAGSYPTNQVLLGTFAAVSFYDRSRRSQVRAYAPRSPGQQLESTEAPLAANASKRA